MPDKLVATGDPDADAYLKTARATLVPPHPALVRRGADEAVTVLPSDHTTWQELKPSDQIHITYTSGLAIAWTFVGFAGRHPDKPVLHVVQYTEHGTWRDPSQVRELAVYADEPVAAVHKTGPTE